MKILIWTLALAAACGSDLGPDVLDTGLDDVPLAALHFEDEVLELVNLRRFAGGACGSQSFPSSSPLTMDLVLRAPARNHSADMAER